jgi:hypothetical protein
VPGEVLRRRPVGGVCGEGNLFVFHAGQQEGGFAGLGEVPRGDEHGVVVAEGPQAPADSLKRQFWCSKSAHRPIYAPYFLAFSNSYLGPTPKAEHHPLSWEVAVLSPPRIEPIKLLCYDGDT